MSRAEYNFFLAFTHLPLLKNVASVIRSWKAIDLGLQVYLSLICFQTKFKCEEEEVSDVEGQLGFCLAGNSRLSEVGLERQATVFRCGTFDLQTLSVASKPQHFCFSR